MTQREIAMVILRRTVKTINVWRNLSPIIGICGSSGYFPHPVVREHFLQLSVFFFNPIL